MSIPQKTDPKWKDVVTGNKSFALKFLASKILVSRLIRSVRNDGSDANVSAAISELHEMFTKNADNPSVKEDVKTIFG